MSIAENACTLAVLILHDDGIAVTAEKISKLLKAANIKVESYWPTLFTKLLEKRGVDDLISGVAAGGGGASATSAAPASAAAASAPAAAPAAEEKKEEPKEESDDDMGFGLFD